MAYIISFLASRTWIALRGQRGQGLVEYGIIITLIAIVVIAVLITNGTAIQHLYSNITCGFGASCPAGDQGGDHGHGGA